MEGGSLRLSIKTKRESKKEKAEQETTKLMSAWITVVGPDSSVVDPAELVEVTTVRVVKIVSWGEDDGSVGRSRKVHVQEARWGGCRRRTKSVKRYERRKERN